MDTDQIRAFVAELDDWKQCAEGHFEDEAMAQQFAKAAAIISALLPVYDCGRILREQGGWIDSELADLIDEADRRLKELL